jgi:hypothetical protein
MRLAQSLYFDGIQSRFLAQWSGQKRKNITLDGATSFNASPFGSPTQQIEKKKLVYSILQVIFRGVFFSSKSNIYRK